MAYVNFTNNLVVTGLAKVLTKSLGYLYEQVDSDCIKEKDASPLVEVRLDLVGDDVRFSPSVGRYGNGKGVRDALDKTVSAARVQSRVRLTRYMVIGKKCWFEYAWILKKG